MEESNLLAIKPDLRVYGFNNPSPSDVNDTYGYEVLATIPSDMDVPKPLIKKQFEGGLYAAHCIKFGDFHEWATFWEWIQTRDEYEYDAREPLGMNGCLEETLNAFSNLLDNNKAEEVNQLDLLLPIIIKKNK